MSRISNYRVTPALALAAAFLVPAHGAIAKKFNVLYSFQDSQDGAAPHAGLVKDGSGNLYGTTFYGGDTQLGYGTLFELAPDGTKTVLHAFAGGPDGGLPTTVTIDGAGNLYGSAQWGGLAYGCNGNGCGVVFEVAPDGDETVLYTFSGANDGAYPQGAVVLDRKGGLYGTAQGGGADKAGVIFRLTSDGKEKVLHTFAGGSDGDSPLSGLISDRSGNLFGTTNRGGGSGCGGGAGCGTIFELAKDGSYSVLYAFTDGSDGGSPVGGLLLDKSGNLYGTTEFGGNASDCGGTGCGTVFKLAPGGAPSTLYTFTGGSDGGQPVASLVSDHRGNLYGTTLFWGAGYGVAFKLAPDGTETVLHSFTNGNDGAYPWGALLAVDKNTFASTASGGGDKDFGTLFSLRK